MGHLRRAVALAKLASGDTFPNPLVGAVLVRDGEIIGEGFHAYAGAVHAEVAGLQNCLDARASTLYVTLEPCAHEGRQPPCTAAIVAAGIRRVVIGALDPNPRTAGAGIARLRAAGIEVEVRSDPACLRLIEDFSMWVTSERPYLALKMAASLDGFVASTSGEIVRLTGEAWFNALQERRAAHQAVMVGAGTVLIDDPLLTVRDGSRRVPFVRIIIAGERALPATLRLFQEVPGYDRTIVVVTDETLPWVAQIRKVAQVALAPRSREGVDLRATLELLRRDHGIHSIFCEGGPSLASRLLEAKLVHRVLWVVAPRLLSGPNAVPVLAQSATLDRSFVFDELEKVGEDMLLSGKMETSV